jgi:hypothetical protein
MRSIKLYTLSAAASVLLTVVAHADDRALFARGGSAGEAMHRTVEAPRGLVHYPELHWTSRIGPGAATAFETGRDARADGSSVRVRERVLRYPDAYWASRIGTGTVTVF